MISDKLKNFINENMDLINQNTKESWEEIYHMFVSGKFWGLSGEFTKMILDARINDPAIIIGYVPNNYLYESTIQDYKIPDNVTSIGSFAFAHCDNLTEIIIPNGVINIDVGAFDACINLTKITIPDSVTSIGSSAFYNCDSLTSIEIPNGVTSISYQAFRDCSSLTSVVIPNSVTSISDYAFESCSNLKEIQFKGTKKQAIELGIGNRSKKKWRKNSAIEKIICTDGVIEL